MPSPCRATRAAAHLRQLACLDAGGPQSIAAVLRELHHLVGFDAGCFIHPAADGEVDVFMENPALRAAVPDYFDPRILRSELQVLHRSSRQFDETLRLERGVQMLPQIARVSLPELLRSDFYNVVLRPGDVGDGLSLALRTPQGQGVGILKLYRSGWARRFTADDAAVLGRFEALLARALQAGEADADDSEVCGQGLLIVTRAGRLQWVSPEARALLQMAFGARWNGGDLPAAVRMLVERLFWSRSDPPGSDPESALPSLAVRNAHGAFLLRATYLTGAAGPGDVGQDEAGPGSEAEAAAIQITRRVARGVRLLARLRALGLPRRQCELACWLARDLSESRIAERMGVSVNTVVYHRRQLYARLGVTNREALRARLVMPDGMGPA